MGPEGSAISPFPIQLTVGVALLGAALLGYAIVRLVAVVRASVIARVPAVPEQDVEFMEAGQVVLCIESTRFDTAFGGVQFAAERRRRTRRAFCADPVPHHGLGHLARAPFGAHIRNPRVADATGS